MILVFRNVMTKKIGSNLSVKQELHTIGIQRKERVSWAWVFRETE